MKKLVTLGNVIALICCLCVVANSKTDPEMPKVAVTSTPTSVITDAKRNEKLRADVQRLVGDAKAGKLKTPAPQFPQPTQRNNLSKGAKIGIFVGIGAAILVLYILARLGSD